MKIYTKTGDKGTTSLVGGERVFKTDERVEAYGSVDELAAFTALLCDNMRSDAALTPYVDDLNRILSRLMTVEALLARGKSGCEKVAPLAPEAVTWLEGRIDALQAAVPPIDKFTIPGGNAVVSMCHVCRTVCRRAERAALRADEKYGTDAEALMFLNRRITSMRSYACLRRITRSMKPCGFRNLLSASVFILHRRCFVVFSLFFSFFLYFCKSVMAEQSRFRFG